MRATSSLSSTVIDILELAKRVGGFREYQVSSYVCIKRKGTPWRVKTLAGLDERQATAQNGYVYDRRTGKRLVLDVPSHDELRPLTRDRVDSLVVREFLDLTAHLKYSTCTDKQIEQLVP